MPGISTVGQRWAQYRASKAALFWLCAASVVATMIVGFAWGGWVTGGTAAQQAAKAAETARAEMAAAVCVNQFDRSPEVAANRVSLQQARSWERDDFIQKGGWVTLPGMKDPVSGAAALCAQQLMESQPPAAKAAGTAG